MVEPAPHPAPWKTWLLKTAITVGVIVLVLGVTALVLYTRAEGEWKQLEAEHAARGDSLDWQSVIPPEVPVEKNFAYTPALVHLNEFEDTLNGGIRFTGSYSAGYPKWSSKAKLWRPAHWRFGSYRGYQTPIEAVWHRLDNGLHRTLLGAESTNQPPQGVRAQAEDILAKLKPFDPVINELMQARKARPQMRFNLRYDKTEAILMPHLAPLKNVVNTHRYRGSARLALGDAAGALEDFEMCLFLSRSFNNEPMLISHLIAVAFHGISMNLLFDGLSSRKWNEAQLAVIEKELSQNDWLTAFHHSARGERNMLVAFIDNIAKDRLASRKAYSLSWVKIPSAMFLMPGVLRQNKTKIVRLYDEQVFSLVDLKTRTVNVRRANHFLKHPFESKRLKHLLVSEFFGAFTGKTARKSARGQTTNDLARLAVALERHRLAEGDYAEKLAALAPRFLAKIPHDVMNGKPLNYKRLKDDYLLYSVGRNLRDESGLIVEKDYNADDIRWFAKPIPRPKLPPEPVEE